MGRLGLKIFAGMSKEEYVQLIGSKTHVGSGDYYNLHVDIADKGAELEKLAQDKKHFEGKLNQLFESRQLGSPMKAQTQQQQRGCSANEFNNYFKLLTQMEQQHQTKLNNLRKQINQLKTDKNENVSSRQAVSTGQCPQSLYSSNAYRYSKSNAMKSSYQQHQQQFVSSSVHPNGHHFPCQEEMWV